LWPCPVSDSESSSTNKDENFSTKTSIRSVDELGVWLETILKMSNEMFLGTAGLIIVFDDPNSVSEVFIAVIGDELYAPFTRHSIFTTLRILTDGKHHLTQA
jgi:hypothetical protein